MNTKPPPHDNSELLQDDVQPTIAQIVTSENLDKFIEGETTTDQSH